MSSEKSAQAFDLIFIDPPFDEELHQLAVDKFFSDAWLKPQGLMYIEMPVPLNKLQLPDQASWYKQSKAGRLHFGLLKREFI